MDSSACLAPLCSASLRDLLPSLLCYPFHTVTLKSVGVSIWSWIGGYLLAFCGIHHHPVSSSSSCWNMSFTPLRWLVTVTVWWYIDDLKSLGSLGIFSDMNGVLYFIILPVALSFLDSLLSFWTFKPPQNPVLSERLTNCQTCMFESERNVLPNLESCHTLFSALNLRKLPLSLKSSPAPNHWSLLQSFHAF